MSDMGVYSTEAWMQPEKNKGLEGERKSGIAYFHESKGEERLRGKKD